MNRRDFLAATMAGLGLSTVAGPKGCPATELAAKPKRVGLIGSGWYGKIDLLRLIQVAPVEVVSLCDVDSRMLAEAAELVATRQLSKKKPRTYGDYRQMLKERDLDIVLVATPDHWHALPMIAAVEAGADVYVQKPISVDVLEGEAMLAAARKHQRVVQVGTQRRSTPHLIEARDKVIREGKLGKVGMVEIYCYSRGGGRGRALPPPSAPPEYLDYEMWTGPAPMRPYTPMVHPRSWRSFMEYGNGTMGDMGIHMLDMVRWMLELGWPKRIDSTGGIYFNKDGPSNCSDTQTATFEYDDLSIVWQHRRWGDAPDPKDWWGATFYGKKGTLKASVFRYEFFPSGKKEATLSGTPLFEYDKFPEDETEKDLERHVASAVRWHMLDLLKAIASRGRPVADIEQGHISSASCIMANMAMKLGRTLRYDPLKREIAGDEEATRLLRRPYRRPWIHPEPA